MKTRTRIFALTLVAMSVSACAQYVPQADGPAQGLSLEVFYTELSPYGRWMDYPPYGFVWVPNVPPAFTPYLTAGHWVYTRYGWTWHSYYDWGWAAFHYGRWHYDVAFGWLWFPDTVWGPAWVAWRSGGGYCGWAPLGIGISIDVVIHGGYIIPHDRWIFVHDRDLWRRNVHRYAVNRSSNMDLVRHATINQQLRQERSTTYAPGPEKEEIQRSANRPIRERTIAERGSPGASRLQRERVEIYKPEARAEKPADRKAVPSRVYKPSEIRKYPQGEEPQRPAPIPQRRRYEPQRQPTKTPPPPANDDNQPQRRTDTRRRGG